MAQKTGALIFDETADRYDIRFDIADYYGGLHCGECMDVFTGGKWKPTRIEYGDNEHTDTYTVQVPYEYYILNVKLTNTPLSTIAENNLTPEQLEMYRVYLQTSGNKPLIFGGGSPDTSASEDLSGVDFVNGTRPGNTAIVDLAKQQVGNVGGYPYWSWYASTPAWNGAPVLCPGATGKWGFPNRALPPASRRVFRGLPLTDNGERGAMKTLPPATLSFLTGT